MFLKRFPKSEFMQEITMDDARPDDGETEKEVHPAFKAGMLARQDGQPRELFPAGDDAKAVDWLAGWDNANKDLPPLPHKTLG